MSHDLSLYGRMKLPNQAKQLHNMETFIETVFPCRQQLVVRSSVEMDLDLLT